MVGLAVALAAALAPSGGTLAQGEPCPGADAVGPPEALAQTTLCLVNQARAAAGAPSLALNPTLGAAANAHAADMAGTGYFSTVSPADGGGAALRAFNAGYGTDGARTAGEVIYAGQGTGQSPRSAVSSWLSKPDERAILVAPARTDAGLAVRTASGGPFGAESMLYAFFVGGAVTPDPIPEETVVLKRLSGTVTVTPRPGAARRKVTGATSALLGARIDTTRGRVRLTSAVDLGRRKESSVFYEGVFTPTQTRIKRRGGSARRLVTTLKLVGGNFAKSCGKTAGATTARAAKKRKPVRRLWGNGKGNYRTQGRVASAEVRATIWLTEDGCEGTTVTVRRGVVDVRDRKRGRTFKVPAGKSVLVRG